MELRNMIAKTKYSKYCWKETLKIKPDLERVKSQSLEKERKE